jgi:hypothetical protein
MTDIDRLAQRRTLRGASTKMAFAAMVFCQVVWRRILRLRCRWISSILLASAPSCESVK